ncbi:two-component sensor histidine kinase (plasmid) [Chelatococcus daeguensis]|uniref:C4-dicarboxylate transport sensor protein DctB n=1 Tax=Chelatococcus daeguensis TaxID=444444 RepID=A0AAC9P1D3_9HYPH|nr:two-component sensor histidine kinase [Chelatococcus daeguensis]
MRKIWLTWARLGVLVVLACAAAIWGGTAATRIYLAETAARGQTTLRLAVAALHGHMRRYEPLPSLIADHDDIRELARRPENPGLRAAANRYLKEINGLLESSDIYVMAPDGVTIAASNYDEPLSFVGENFSYRPYFQDAMKGERGRFFALGTTSLKRGYYYSAPIRDGEAIRGVVVFKVDVDVIELSWRGSDHVIIVTDPEGIVFLTGRDEWRYAGLEPLTPERLARTHASRRYADARLYPLPIESHGSEAGHALMTIGEANGEPREYLVLSEPMPEAGWTVKVLLDTASARAQAFTALVAIFLCLALAGMVAAVVLQRRARMAERMALQQEARETLERRVAERTRDLAAVNSRLETEVAERRATEQRLRQTQDDLIQAGKLAALGQMSAALSHEFNQPLAALRTYADNAAVLIDHDRIADARENVRRIAALTDRLASISRHLRNFARKPNQKLGPVDVREVVRDTLEIVAWRLRAAQAELVTDIGEGPLMVRGGAVRLQQVLVNLITNAADAVEGRPERTITLRASRQGGQVLISVSDPGPGVPDAIAGRIFDPFFTTKGVGKGLGLGLSISYNIIQDFGGNLLVANAPEGGAVFTIQLAALDLGASREAAE